jgi:ferredoxin
MSGKQKEYQVIVVNPVRCINCEACMSICSFIHETRYLPLEKRIIGMRVRIELEWAISCDLCSGIKEKFSSIESEKIPQCIGVCLNDAIFISIIEAYEDESRMDAIRRTFPKNQIH